MITPAVIITAMICATAIICAALICGTIRGTRQAIERGFKKIIDEGADDARTRVMREAREKIADDPVRVKAFDEAVERLDRRMRLKEDGSTEPKPIVQGLGPPS